MAAEADLEKKIGDWLAEEYPEVEYLKWVSPGRRGVPDRILIFPGGVTGFMELKAPGGTVSGHQARFLKKLDDLGHHWVVCYTFERAKEFILKLWLEAKGA